MRHVVVLPLVVIVTMPSVCLLSVLPRGVYRLKYVGGEQQQYLFANSRTPQRQVRIIKAGSLRKTHTN